MISLIFNIIFFPVRLVFGAITALNVIALAAIGYGIYLLLQ